VDRTKFIVGKNAREKRNEKGKPIEDGNILKWKIGFSERIKNT